VASRAACSSPSIARVRRSTMGPYKAYSASGAGASRIIPWTPSAEKQASRVLSDPCASPFSLIFVPKMLPAVLALFTLLGADGGPVPSSANLLVGLPPPLVVKVKNVERMTDGRAPEPGDNWESQYTSIIEPEGSVTWDFGAPTDFDGAWLQSDNNDVYLLWTSDDGVNFRQTWEALSFDMAPGMQARWSQQPLHAHGRYVKLTARGGDQKYSVGELALFKD